MVKDYIGYQALTDAALRGVVRDALKRVESQGLIGSHHFYLTFKTHFPGVELPSYLREQYPDEMTIILQHQFWGLKVFDAHFEVALTFRKMPATLEIPYAALTAFYDPGVQFGLQFKSATADGRAVSPVKPLVPVRGDDPADGEGVPPQADGADTDPPASEAPEHPAGTERPAGVGEVVSLDQFRKK